MPGLPIAPAPLFPEISAWAVFVALALITVIGLDLLLRGPRRREDRGHIAMMPGDIDPANLRRRRPLTQRLSGAVLLAAVIVLYIVLSPVIGR